MLYVFVCAVRKNESNGTFREVGRNIAELRSNASERPSPSRAFT